MSNDQTEFLAALNGGKGDLDAWLEVNDEAEVRAAIKAAIAAQAQEAPSEPVAPVAAFRECRHCGWGCRRVATHIAHFGNRSTAPAAGTQTRGYGSWNFAGSKMQRAKNPVALNRAAPLDRRH